MDHSNLAVFGVAGNFTGHLEQAGEAEDFVGVQAKACGSRAATPPASHLTAQRIATSGSDCTSAS